MYLIVEITDEIEDEQGMMANIANNSEKASVSIWTTGRGATYSLAGRITQVSLRYPT